MTDFQQAMKLAAGNLGLHVIENPNHTFSFVGSVPVVLSYFRRDGQPLTDEDIAGIKQHGAGLYRKTIGSRVWPTRDAAIAEAESLGFKVAQ